MNETLDQLRALAQHVNNRWVFRGTITAADGEGGYTVQVGARNYPYDHVRSISNVPHAVGDQVILILVNRDKQRPLIVDQGNARPGTPVNAPAWPVWGHDQQADWGPAGWLPRDMTAAPTLLATLPADVGDTGVVVGGQATDLLQGLIRAANGHSYYLQLTTPGTGSVPNRYSLHCKAVADFSDVWTTLLDVGNPLGLTLGPTQWCYTGGK